MKNIITLLALALCLNNNISAQPFVLIPDVNFANYLGVLIPAAMHGDSLNTTHTLVTTTTHSINAQGLGIANLSGVQYFTSLTFLGCSTNSLTTLPALPNSLTYLNCYRNSLTTLPTLPNSLDTLDCSSNSLTSLPALPNSLTYLGCNSNSLASLPTLPNTLVYLDCSGNSITNLPALPNSLIHLFCYANYNYLTSLPALPNSLITLDCSADYSLTSLPTLPNSLKNLHCSSDYLQSLPALPNGLQGLSCDNNNIYCFPTFPNSITNIYLGFNPCNCLPNHIAAMSAADLAAPLCAAGNSYGCPVATGIEQFASNNEVSIYPNPASTHLTLTLSKGEGTANIEIYNTIGECVHRQLIQPTPNPSKEGTSAAIDISDLAAGIYNLSLISNEGTVNKRVVVVK